LLNLGINWALEVSTEDVGELTASHSDPMSAEDPIILQEANKAPPKGQVNDEIVQSPPTKTLERRELQ
jgi:hypothetical protein